MRNTITLEISYTRKTIMDGFHEHWFGYNKDIHLHPDKRSFKANGRKAMMDWIDSQLETLLQDDFGDHPIDALEK